MQAQMVWHNPLSGDTAKVQGRGWNTELKDNYHRMPDRLKPVMRDAVWQLSTNSAGLHIDFYSNAPEIVVRYTVSGNKQTEIGKYTVTVSLRDKENTIWEDGTTDDLTFNFEIKRPFNANDKLSYLESDFDTVYENGHWTMTGNTTIITIKKETVAMWIERGNTLLDALFTGKDGQRATFSVYLTTVADENLTNAHDNCEVKGIVLSDYIETGITFYAYYGRITDIDPDGFNLWLYPFGEEDSETWIKTKGEIEYANGKYITTVNAGELLTIRKESVNKWINDGNLVLNVNISQKDKQSTIFDTYLGGEVGVGQHTARNSVAINNLYLEDYKNSGIVIAVYYGTIDGSEEASDGYELSFTFLNDDETTWLDANFEIEYANGKWTLTGNTVNVTVKREVVAMFIARGYTSLDVKFGQKDGQNTTLPVYLTSVAAENLTHRHNFCTVEDITLADYTETGITFLVYYEALSGESDGFYLWLYPFGEDSPETWVKANGETTYSDGKIIVNTEAGNSIYITKKIIDAWLNNGYTAVDIKIEGKDGRLTSFDTYLGGVVGVNQHAFNVSGTISGISLEDYRGKDIIILIYFGPFGEDLSNRDGFTIELFPA